MLGLMAIGLAAIHVSELADASMTDNLTRQLMFVPVALAAFFLMLLLPYPALGQMSYLLFGATLLALAGVFLLEPTRGSYRWYAVGPIKIQPSEIAKFTTIIMLAWYLRYGDHYRRLRGLIVPFLLTLVPMGLVLMEPDLGTGMLFLPTLFIMLFVAGARLKHLLVILGLGVSLVLLPMLLPVDAAKFQRERSGFTARSLGPVTLYSVDKSRDWHKRPKDVPVAYARLQWRDGTVYDIQPLALRVMAGNDQTAERAQRVAAWLRPDDPRLAMGKGFQPRLGRLILGSGGMTGGDWSQETAGQADGVGGEDYFSVLPDDHTDFIFCVVGGQWGFVGCLVILLLYAVIFLFGLEIAVVTYDPFGRLLVVGVLALLFSQIIINVGMTLGLTPVTGMTLPWISYGGTSLVVNCAAVGLLINVGQHRPILLGRRPFEHGDGD